MINIAKQIFLHVRTFLFRSIPSPLAMEIVIAIVTSGSSDVSLNLVRLSAVLNYSEPSSTRFLPKALAASIGP